MLGCKQVILKAHTVRDEYCTVCKEFLTGNGSMVSPWKCGCGTYEFDWRKSGYKHPKEGEEA
jgi:hypothetical protein